MIITSILIAAAGLIPSISAACIKPVSSCNASVDYFPVLPEFKYASSVSSISKTSNSTVSVNLVAPDLLTGANTTYRYLFVRCGCPTPSSVPENTTVIAVPIGSIMLTETVTVPKVVLLGQLSSIAFFSDATYVTTPTVLTAVQTGAIRDVQNDYSLVEQRAPDVIVTSTGRITSMLENGTSVDNPSWYSRATVLERLRFIDTDQFESTPLGRAELVKLYGVLFGVESAAQDLFDTVERNYISARERAFADVKRRPTIGKGWPFGGNWSVTSRRSYFGQFLRDANVDFIGSQDLSRSMIQSTAYGDLFSQAEFWIDALVYAPDGSLMTEDKLLGGNASRSASGDAVFFNSFVSVQCGNVYANDKKLLRTGNAFFEEGVMRPDLVLSDLVQMFHPNVASNGTLLVNQTSLYFYRKVSPTTNATLTANRAACPLKRLPSSVAAGTTYVQRSFTIRNANPAFFNNLIPNYLKPEAAKFFGASSVDNVDIYVKNKVMSENTTFEINVVVATPSSSANTIASNMKSQNNIDSFVSLVSKATSDYTSARSAGVSLFTTSPTASKVTVETTEESVVMMNGDGTTTVYSDNIAGLSRGAFIGVMVGSSVIFVLLLGALWYFAYNMGSRNAYRRLGGDKPPPMPETGAAAAPEMAAGSST